MLSDQLGSDLAQWNCGRANPAVMIAIGICGGTLALAGGLLALRYWRKMAGDLTQPYAGARRFIAVTGALAAGIFLLAILFQTSSSLIIPQCHA
jgi:hypothetical protein